MTALMPLLKSQTAMSSLYSARVFSISAMVSASVSPAGMDPKFFLVKLRHLW